MELNCKIEKCKKQVRAKGYCDIHYKKWRRGELPKPRYKICQMENCRKPMLARGFCKEHFDAMLTEKSKAKAVKVEPAVKEEAPKTQEKQEKQEKQEQAQKP